MSTGEAMLSQQSGRGIVMLQYKGKNLRLDEYGNIAVDSIPIVSTEITEEPSKKYPSQRVVNKYRTPKLPKNNRKK